MPYTLKYDLRGAKHAVKYTLEAEGKVTFTYTDGAGKVRTETHTRRQRKMGLLPLVGGAVGVLLLGLGGIFTCRRYHKRIPTSVVPPGDITP